MKKNNQGMTLIETVIATIVLAAITLTANSFMMGYVNANQSIKNVTEATKIGNQQLENLRTGNYDAVFDHIDTVDAKYQCRYKIIESGALDMKRVALTVAWPLQSLDNEIELSTVLEK